MSSIMFILFYFICLVLSSISFFFNASATISGEIKIVKSVCRTRSLNASQCVDIGGYFVEPSSDCYYNTCTRYLAGNNRC